MTRQAVEETKRPRAYPILKPEQKILYREIARGIRTQLSVAFNVSQADKKRLEPGALRCAADAMDLFCRYMDDMPIDTDLIRSLIARAARHTVNFSIYSAHCEIQKYTTPQAMLLADAARRESQMSTQLLKQAYELAQKIKKDKQRAELTVPGYLAQDDAEKREERIEQALEDETSDIP